ncbi:tRNA methyltransferase subunit 11-2 [Dermatophagoides pteronyssinus]|uniref:Uncharacterized protein n=2 Tax=Dermatophagoides pteronyssinus TaxID=6956 RepID=A0ABQ8JRH8_DERPT|nr:multifunctional methyltransferase subunit TRM112-like protein [Dermatophagoides pteronyssinus]KAH9424886.1 hypothetical protein DERP_009108 [Dermatophagoides pteronyssinus]
MKLLTHNFLTSKCLKGVVTGYPLKLVVNEMNQTQVDFNPDFIKRILPKMEYDALRETATTVGVELPVQKDETGNEDFLRQLHHALLEIEIVNGDLICPETGRKFPIKDGIPNMLCNEDEV